MNNCKTCGVEIKKRIYCSNKCKFSDSSYNQNRVSKTKNPTDQRIQHKITKKIFTDVLNKSGILGKYSEKELGQPLNWDDWEIIDIVKKQTWNCPHDNCKWTTVDVDNKSGWITTHLSTVHQLNPNTHTEKYPEDKKLWKQYFIYSERADFIQESEKNKIQCLECGEWFKQITNSHLLEKHKMTKDAYREKHNVQVLASTTTRQKLSDLYFQRDEMVNEFYTSKYETEIIDFLLSIGIPTIQTYRKLGFEIDIYSEEHKIGIEFNGLYFHSELAGKKNELYHLNKTDKAEQNGIHLIHIFEDEWLNKQDIIKSRLCNLFGKNDTKIFARKCTIKEISNTPASLQFLEDNHLQGKDNSSIRLGLFFNEELISAMTFRKPSVSMGHRKTDGIIELSRFCNKKYTNVVGSASKLLSYFLKNYSYDEIISYADRRWTPAGKNLYNSIGFNLMHSSSPNYWYMKNHSSRIPRFNFTKHKIIKNFELADPSLSEFQNMVNLGYDRIWDCGNYKYSLLRKIN